jgi:hypothetical protein
MPIMWPVVDDAGDSPGLDQAAVSGPPMPGFGNQLPGRLLVENVWLYGFRPCSTL